MVKGKNTTKTNDGCSLLVTYVFGAVVFSNLKNIMDLTSLGVKYAKKGINKIKDSKKKEVPVKEPITE